MVRQFLLIAFLLAACARPPPPPVPATPTVLALPPVPAACAATSEDLAAYFSLSDGYCLLYPAHFRANNLYARITKFSGPPSDLTAALTILIEDSAGGRTLSHVVDEYLAQFGAGAPGSRAAATLGGEAAVVVEGIPGRSGSREAFVIHGDVVYHLSAYPLDDLSQARPDVEAVWQAVTASFTFLPPGFAEALSICPTGSDAAAPYLSFAHGVCLAYPAPMSLSVIPATHEIILSGPPREPGSEAVAVNLILRAGDAANGRAADQLADAYLSQFTAGPTTSVTRAPTAIGGQPGVILDGVPGLTQTRRAFVVHDDRAYEFTLSPFGDPAHADYQPEAEAAWQMVTSSLVFVTTP
jgi:hypothetical protein